MASLNKKPYIITTELSSQENFLSQQQHQSIQNRTVVLAEEINEESVSKAVKEIMSINAEDVKLSNLYGDNYKSNAITLVINTYGGEVQPGLALIGAIESIETPVVTVAFGAVYSMGLPIFLSGDERIAHRYASFMYHELSSLNFGNIEEIKHNLVEQDKVQETLDNHIIERSKITKKKLTDIRKAKKDWYFYAEEALELGVVDILIGKNGKIKTPTVNKRKEKK